MKIHIAIAISLLFGLTTFSTQVEAHKSDATLIAKIRQATAKYLDVKNAKADGYRMASNMVPNMGYHFRNAKIRGFEVDKPNLLLYIKHDDGSFQLAGVEWGWPKGKQPKSLPFKNAQWRDHGAACHYKDGTETHKASPKSCPKKSPKTGVQFAAWHPTLSTVHVWAWYPNPAGAFKSHNMALAPFNKN
ncbi:MAG: hypothetical protein HOC91_00490 [Nitrospinaceae bacterium]|nr:hypothetical protein [Nitrospinaceae bacterium]MBT3433044.1 hypothetical protein [Nitrospinaceae bacterium]MBT3819872.1 hypothetical protein [Nitrospinaceae bacterium]MBT4092362.1 hypothetical protein [Nitrospinaceae bacterium]MBT4428971.1 hypothetical protein [Nitrospinaceae bacterium]